MNPMMGAAARVRLVLAARVAVLIQQCRHTIRQQQFELQW